MDQSSIAQEGVALAAPSIEESSSKTLPRTRLTNQSESKSFLATALAWQGSVTPRVLPRVIVSSMYAAVILAITWRHEHLVLPITPFEYSGAVLALILVMRVNAGHDRWWEARRIWGGIVNQSRNLALVIKGYGPQGDRLVSSALAWVAAWPHVMRASLRYESPVEATTRLLGASETAKIQEAGHMPTYVGQRIIAILQELRQCGLDPWAFLRAETERSQLIDAIGACERIRNTRMPLVLAIKTRRFILLFILLLPFALVDRVGLVTPLIVALTAYPLFSLDEIGAELQNPFSPRNLSHLPLDEICAAIETNIHQIARGQS